MTPAVLVRRIFILQILINLDLEDYLEDYLEDSSDTDLAISLTSSESSDDSSGDTKPEESDGVGELED